MAGPFPLILNWLKDGKAAIPFILNIVEGWERRRERSEGTE